MTHPNQITHIHTNSPIVLKSAKIVGEKLLSMPAEDFMKLIRRKQSQTKHKEEI